MKRARSVPLLTALVAALAFAPSDARAQGFKQPEETLPGFKAHSVFEGKGIENLSLFNGDPQLAVPLGPEYPLGYGVSFRLTAHYSTRFWHMYQTECLNRDNGVMELHGRARVRGLPSLGVGWTLELGAFDPAPSPGARSRYFSPDGGVHEFGDAPVGTMQAPEDGSAIRIRKLAEGGYVVHHPDGTTHWLTHSYQRPDPKTGWGNEFDFTDVDGSALDRRTARWGLKEIRNRDNVVVADVHWSTTKPWMMESISLPDASRAIVFGWTRLTPAGQGVTWDVLGSIEFPILASASSVLAVTMGYSSSGQFRRSSFEENGNTDCGGLASSDIYLPFLTSITQHTDVYGFDYSFTDSLGVAGTGLLTSYRLPTGLLVEYGYSDATAPIPCLYGTYANCSSLDETNTSAGGLDPVDPADRWRRLQGYLDRAPAVITRTETDPTNGNSASTTTYERRQFAPRVGENPPYDTYRDPKRVLRRVIVRRPSGNGDMLATRHIFHVLTDGSDDGSEPVTSGPGLEVERRTYAGSVASGAPVRSNVSCFDRTFAEPYTTYCGALDASGAIVEFPMGFSHMQPSREVTWYGTNPPGAGECSNATAYAVACHYVSRAGWDPEAQEFEQETVGAPSQGPGSLFLQSGLLGRRTTTAWNPRSGTVPWPYWQPKLYTSRTVEDLRAGICPVPPCAVTTEARHDEPTGKLISFKLGDESLSRTTTLDYTNGSPTTETVSGVGLTGTYQTVRTFQNGLLTTSLRTQPADPGWMSYDVTRDGALGLVTTSRDANRQATTYSWDPLGRLSAIAPPGGEHPTTICYAAWSASNAGRGAWALVRKGGSLSCDTSGAPPAEGSETVEAYLYDGSGRLHREVRLLPNAVSGSFLAMRSTERSAAGLVTAVSEWVSCGSGTDLSTCFSAPATTTQRTTYSSFDPFGRPRTIDLPDGTKVTKSYDDWEGGYAIPYSDTREDTITSNVAGGSIFQATRRDILGRVVLACEPVPSPPTGELPLTTYRYDIHDGLALVEATRRMTAGSTVTQQRSYRRNVLGYLTSAQDPESGETTWTSYDALGNAKEKTTGGVRVSTDYDALGRPTRVYTPSGQEYVRSYYDGSEGGLLTGAYLGKLTKRVGYNPGAFENARVEEVYTYGGRGGRLSSRQMTFLRGTAGSPTVASLSQTLTWNTLGLPETRTQSAPGAPFSTTTYYTSGAPTRIVSDTQTTLVSSATYHPHGGLSSYTTGNGVTTTLEADPSGLPRPSRIVTREAASNFDTGTYTYDGAGNVTSMGPVNGRIDAFTYDRLSRLKTATWRTVTPTETFVETFTYDGDGERGFGNLTGIATQGRGMPEPVDLSVDPFTNRLAQGAYDARGNLTAFPAGVSVPELAFGYDALARRTSDTRQGKLVSWNLYDAEHERVARVLPETNPADGPLRFYTLTPCRLVDTRAAPGAYGGPHLTAGQEREVTAPGQCGIPGGAVSLVGNVTTVPRADSGGVTGTHTWGFLKLYPANVPVPAAAAGVISPGRTRAQFAFGKLSAEGAFRLVADLPATETVDAIVDVSGYFAPASATSSARQWLLTQRDEENRPAADWRWVEGSPSAQAEAFHVYLGATKVASRELTPTAAWAFYSSDHLGTPRLKTGPKPQGQPAPVLESYRYRAYGEKFEAVGQPDRSGREFAMMERDSILPPGTTTASGTGNHYVHARFYADRFARFLSPDQVMGRPEQPQSFNRYAYARNNPLKYVDPDGREEMDAVLMSMQRTQLREMGGEAAVRRFDTSFAIGAGAFAGIVGGGAALGYFGAAGLGVAATTVANTPTGQQVLAAAAEFASGAPMPGAVPTLSSLSSALKPGGMKIGEELANTTIRGLVGTKAEAASTFKQLIGSASVKKIGNVLVADVAGGGTVKLRDVSSTAGTVATIELRVKGLGIREIKYFHTPDELNAAR